MILIIKYVNQKVNIVNINKKEELQWVDFLSQAPILKLARR